MKEQTHKFMEEFKAFAMRGNVVDMAVGIIIGGAFGKIVSSVVSDIIMPPIGVLVGGVKFTDLKLTLKGASTDPVTGKVLEAVYLNYGQFLQTTFDFLIIAFSVFLMVKTMRKMQQKEEVKQEAAAPAPQPTKEEQLLTEIRDLLKERK
ncbi:MAG: large-conductance mechanosensitive channel protein MscL [Candidatus Paceibacterota bacterium]|jgi:large conductance mechanosensitive channel|nr:large-conductance mechanosensitive channel protein MscL [Candidatus Paceibacterota bacterium]